MSMNIGSCAKEISDKYNSLKNSDNFNGGCDLLRAIEKSLDKNFQSATPTFKNIDITTPKGSLNFGSCEQSDIFTLAQRIGSGVADYWAKTIEPTGIPQSCGGIAQVTNTASTIAPLITGQLLASANNQISLPPYSNMVSIIITSVKTIIWTVVESSSNCSSTYTVTVT